MVPETRFLSLCGMLGYGYPRESLERGLATNPHFIAVDAGSVDPGPYYLGSGTGFVKPMQIRRDLELALVAAVERGIPLLIGSAGGAGARSHVNSFLEIVRAIAADNDLHFRLAVIYADIPPALVLDRLAEGRVKPCGPVHELTPEHVADCTNLVAQMGTGPIEAALEGGADIIVVGRCCDTAIFAALPMMRGHDPGLAMHCAKIAECGTLCARPAGANDALTATLCGDHFIVEPANPGRRCTPESVMAHSLYEQPSPHGFVEPEGRVDLTEAVFESSGERAVRVSGTRLEPAALMTVKLEGARCVGYRCITVAGTTDPGVMRNMDVIEEEVRYAVSANLEGTLAPDDYSLRFIRYGQNAVSMAPIPPETPQPGELGLVIEAVAPTPEQAATVLSLARSTALHQSFPGRKTTAGNLAFPFSPSDFQGGAVYEFAVYHLMEVGEEDGLFPVTFEDI